MNSASYSIGAGLGRHTTVTRELIALPGGALLLDTPGLRKVGLRVDVAAAFEDVERLAASCRFGDCSHREEPHHDAIMP